uniref:Uncharacterized protein n=1 Tax=Cacopsylla melanoneura TaxID=428564 RepID=A0A8D8SMV1_9HEMI
MPVMTRMKGDTNLAVRHLFVNDGRGAHHTTPLGLLDDSNTWPGLIDSTSTTVHIRRYGGFLSYVSSGSGPFDKRAAVLQLVSISPILKFFYRTKGKFLNAHFKIVILF